LDLASLFPLGANGAADTDAVAVDSSTVVAAVDPEEGGGIVVVAKPMPFGPRLIVWPLTTFIVGVAPGPIVKAVPSITITEELPENVTPPAVIVESDPMGGGMVVVANPMPCGPMLIVCPLTTLVVGVAPGIVNVVPSITTIEGPSENVIPPAVMGVKAASGAMRVTKPDGTIVVEARPIPPGPRLIVCPLTTLVVGVAPGPTVKVVPSITAIEAP
jgi:hypothetical protein